MADETKEKIKLTIDDKVLLLVHELQINGGLSPCRAIVKLESILKEMRTTNGCA